MKLRDAQTVPEVIETLTHRVWYEKHKAKCPPVKLRQAAAELGDHANADNDDAARLLWAVLDKPFWVTGVPDPEIAAAVEFRGGFGGAAGLLSESAAGTLGAVVDGAASMVVLSRWRWCAIEGRLFAAVASPDGDREIVQRPMALMDVHWWWTRGGVDRIEHPLLPLLRAWRDGPIVKRHKRQIVGSLPNFNKAKESMRDIPDLGYALPERQATLPGMNLDELGQPSWLLELYKLMGGEFLREGRGAPLELRMYVGALCAFDIKDRNGLWHTRRYTVDEVIEALWPNGWHNRWRDWRKVPEAIDRLNRSSATLIKGNGMAIDIFRVTAHPTTEAAWKDGRDQERKFVEFTMRIPPSSAHGDRVNMDRLAQLGVKSAPLYCALLSAYAHIGRTARRGKHTRMMHPPLLGEDGKPIRKRVKGKDGKTRTITLRNMDVTEPNPNNKYQGAPLTPQALARMCGLDPSARMYRHRAVRAYQQLHDEGDLEFVRDGGGWRIFSPP